MREKILNILCHELALPPSEITDELSYNSIPEWDSVAHMSLISALEAEFSVVFENDEIVSMTNIGAIERIISNNVETPAPAN